MQLKVKGYVASMLPHAARPVLPAKARGERGVAGVCGMGLLSVVCGAGSEVDGQSFGGDDGDFVVGAPVHVGTGQDIPGEVGRDSPIREVLDFFGRGGGAARLVDDGILIRVLRGILIHERS